MNVHLRTWSSGIISAMSCVAALAAQTGVRAEQTEETARIQFTCNNPEIVARFVAAVFPSDVAILHRAMNSGVCRYADDELRVEPVSFVARVAACEQAMEPFGYIWALRIPNRQIVYAYFWKTEHMAMHKRLSASSRAPRARRYAPSI